MSPTKLPLRLLPPTRPMKLPVILLSLAASGVTLQSTLAFVLSSPLPKSPQLQLSMLPDIEDQEYITPAEDRVSVDRRNLLLKTGPIIASSILSGFDGVKLAGAIPEQKVYSSNAKNMMRLGEGDSSGGSVYDNNPSSAKARSRRAMVGCKNASARSLAGEAIGNIRLNEKECNQLVMKGESDFMLQALTKLDCPSCPYGIGER